MTPERNRDIVDPYDRECDYVSQLEDLISDLEKRGREITKNRYLNLYLIERPKGNTFEYDQYESAVVCAYTEAEARMIHPIGHSWDGINFGSGSWVNASEVRVTLLGFANIDPGPVVCASFRAG